MTAAGSRGWILALLVAQVYSEFGVVRVFPEKGGGGGGGKDYCILFNSQWAHLPHDLAKASLLALQDQTMSVLCAASEVPEGGFGNAVPMVMRGNCTFYEKVRLAQVNGARGLLIVSKERLVPPAGNRSQYEEIDIPVALLSYADMLDIGQSFGHSAKVAMYAPGEPVLDYNMVIIFVMAVGTVAVGGYWAGSRDVKKRYMKHKRDDGAEKQEDETVDVTPVMIGVFVVMCCSMLVLLYYFYDQLVYAIIGIFCLAASIGLYSCLSPFVRRFPLGKCRVPSNNWPYFHKRPQIRMLLLAAFCVAVSLVWGLFRNEDQWAWILQDTLGIAFCLYMLKTIRLPTFKGCTLLLLVLFVYDVFFVFITPYLTKTGESIMVEVAAGPTDSSTREKLPMVLKVPRLNFSPLALCDRPFSLLGFGDILVPGYGIGLLATFAALAWMRKGQPALLYLVPCTLLTSLLVALWRRELATFWTGSGFAKELPHPPLVVSPVSCPVPPKASHPEADGEAAASTAPPREPANTPVDPEEEEEEPPRAPFLEVEQEAKEEETDAAEPQPDQLPAQRPWGESPDDPLKDKTPEQMSPPAEHSHSG
ncbi:signal peptide peptidase-like 2B isoform X2 [Ahaetulla prasina]|uniref:signal peptide peptidase-like 2B isoform X2 n=1 Tax=Ahaetulla prasina TaxID=499056 RepID=UPI002648AD64|nr:signal peptide peptidase-like 2B isoform X2 [Ahaetulla prasina]